MEAAPGRIDAALCAPFAGGRADVRQRRRLHDRPSIDHNRGEPALT
jgi:hypothetical protein